MWLWTLGCATMGHVVMDLRVWGHGSCSYGPQGLGPWVMWLWTSGSGVMWLWTLGCATMGHVVMDLRVCYHGSCSYGPQGLGPWVM